MDLSWEDGVPTKANMCESPAFWDHDDLCRSYIMNRAHGLVISFPILVARILSVNTMRIQRGQYFCQKCKRSYRTSESLVEHYRGSPHHPNCKNCGRGFYDDYVCAQVDISISVIYWDSANDNLLSSIFEMITRALIVLELNAESLKSWRRNFENITPVLLITRSVSYVTKVSTTLALF